MKSTSHQEELAGGNVGGNENSGPAQKFPLPMLRSLHEAVLKQFVNVQRYAPLYSILVLSVLCSIAYLPMCEQNFAQYDDPGYILANPHVSTGFSLDNIYWAFTSLHGNISYWHPLTWLSHMLDSQLFGLASHQHKLSNLWLHIINTTLVFLIFYKLTDKVTRSALVAALFGLHPLHVESVVWIAERKDLLCATFYLLSIAAYCRYAKDGRLFSMAIVLFAYLLALLSKPMAVTLPFALLLLDFWPLNRIAFKVLRPGESPQLPPSHNLIQQHSLAYILCEKLPLIFLSFCVSAVTLYAVIDVGATHFVEVPLPLRIANAPVAYLAYLEKTLWPTGLSILYPHPIFWPDGRTFISFLGVLLLIALAVCTWRKVRYISVGIFWFLGTLVPTLGLVQVGGQWMANRYTYIPHIGLFCATVWLISDYCRLTSAKSKLAASALCVMLVAAMVSATRFYVHKWDTAESLWGYALSTTEGNYVASSALADLADASGRYSEALDYAKLTTAFDPVPFNVVRLAKFYLKTKQHRRAIILCSSELQNSEVGSYANYLTGLALSRSGHEAAAIPFFEAAHQSRPREWITSVELARIFCCSPETTLRNEKKALLYAKRAAILTDFKAPLAVDALAASYAGVGQFDTAEAFAEKAVSLALLGADTNLVRLAEEKGTSYHKRERWFCKPDRYDIPL